MTPPQTAAHGYGRLIQLRPPEAESLEPLPQETAEEAAYRAAVDAAVAVLEAYDDSTAEHSDDVVTLSEAIATRLDVTGEERRHLHAVALLHDIGKVTVPAEILNKTGRLEEDEWRIMRAHTLEGEQILAAVPELLPVSRLVRACHERYDGTGYPDGLAGEDIPLIARIVFCADAFHAMRCDRPYRRGRPAAAALAELRANAGTQFDPIVVEALGDVHRSLAGRKRRVVGLVGATARSRRLVALLAVLTVSGSAMAATGAYRDLPGLGEQAATERQPADGAQRAAAASGVSGSDTGMLARQGHRGPARADSSMPAGDAATRPAPRGVAHGVRGTSPGQAAAKRRGPKAKAPAGRPVKKVKPPKKPKAPQRTTPPPAAKGPKVKVPQVKVPQVRAPTPPKLPQVQTPVPAKPAKP